MTSEQLIRAGDLADEFGQNLLCITTRQTLQFHWIRKEDIYKVIESMERVGVSSPQAKAEKLMRETRMILEIFFFRGVIRILQDPLVTLLRSKKS